MSDEIDVNERAVAGDNISKMTPFEAIEIDIKDLFEEAAQWLDGTKVETQEDADAINTLKDRIKKATKAADDQYDIEVKPHQATVKEIQTRYNALTGNNKSVKGLAVKAEEACNAALEPYLLKLEAEQKEKARLARIEADRLQAIALEAMRSRDAANLAESEAAEKLLNDAKAAEKVAGKAESARPQAKGEGRATGLRTKKVPVMVDKQIAAKWVWLDCNEELIIWIQEQAEKAVRAGKLTIPGFEIREERVL